MQNCSDHVLMVVGKDPRRWGTPALQQHPMRESWFVPTQRQNCSDHVPMVVGKDPRRWGHRRYNNTRCESWFVPTQRQMRSGCALIRIN
jgi:hypothetical protein